MHDVGTVQLNTVVKKEEKKTLGRAENNKQLGGVIWPSVTTSKLIIF